MAMGVLYGEFDGKWQWKKQADRNWRNPGFPQTDTHPVACVSWDDASAYVKWLSGHTGEAYRLLTEAEWEYAARGGTTTMRYWGHDWDNEVGCAYANLSNKEHSSFGFGAGFDCKDGYLHTSPVGIYKANAFGLNDTLGNISELVEDCLNRDYSGAPSDGSAWTSGYRVAPYCSGRVFRGGSWGTDPWYARLSFRGLPRAVRAGFNVGFRVARTLPH